MFLKFSYAPQFNTLKEKSEASLLLAVSLHWEGKTLCIMFYMCCEGHLFPWF